MAYNTQAESYGVKTPRVIRESGGRRWTRFDKVYSDIADATPVEGEWQAAALVGQLPCIEHFAPRTQREIIAVVLRDMQTLPAEADRVRRVKAGWYTWVIAEK